MTLDDIDITNLVWIDEYQFSRVAQQSERSLTGGLIVQEGLKKFGQPITLSDSWLSKATLDLLNAKEATPNLVMTLTLDDGTQHSVIFNRSQGPAVVADPVFKHTNAPDDWQYEARIKLFTVQP